MSDSAMYADGRSGSVAGRHDGNAKPVGDPPYYPVGSEVATLTAAFEARVPVMIKGPTGCGKTRFVEAVASMLDVGLTTVSCHEELGVSDLVGRYLLAGGETVWQDGPLTQAARHGGICYLDEIVEARSDVTVVIHSLTDHRRVLPIDATGELVEAHPDFMLIVSYNPHYQAILKDLKPSTKQRFVGVELEVLPPEVEREVIAREAAVDERLADALTRLGQAVRRADVVTSGEPPSTRTLVTTGRLVAQGLPARTAAAATLGHALTEASVERDGIMELIETYLDP